MFMPQEIITKKRNNKPLTPQEIEWFIKGVVKNTISDAQISALAMAIIFNKLTYDELVSLVCAMRDSGEVLDWSDLDGPIVDKHSTGGVGDLTSFLLVPMVIACGAYVPMIAGRGLGHTGGTLDKLDAIEGYNTRPTLDAFRKAVKEVGGAIIGQTPEVAPADRRIYSVRDVTGTTESLELITSSILSKKLAAGLQTLVMDVKTGNGAFLTELEESIDLAKNIVKIGNGAGCNTRAIITAMDQPLASSAGNALEIKASIDYLAGGFSDPKNQRLHEVNMALARGVLLATGLAQTEEEAQAKLLKTLSSGKALEVFAKMLTSLGAKPDFIERHETYLPKAQLVEDFYVPVPGYLASIDTKKVGYALVAVGGGRMDVSDKINYAVGFSNFASLGEELNSNRSLVTIHAASQADLDKAKTMLTSAVRVVADKAKSIPRESSVYQFIS